MDPHKPIIPKAELDFKWIEREKEKGWKREHEDTNRENHRIGHLLGVAIRFCLAFIGITSGLYWDAFFVRGAGKGYLSSVPGLKQIGPQNPIFLIWSAFAVSIFYYFTVGCVAIVFLPFLGGVFGLLAFGVFAAAGAVFGAAHGQQGVIEFAVTQGSGLWAWLASQAHGPAAAAASASLWTHFWIAFAVFVAWTVAASVAMSFRLNESRAVAYSMDEGRVLKNWMMFVPWAVVVVSILLNGYILTLFSVFAAASFTVKRYIVTSKRDAQAQATLDSEARQDRVAVDAQALRSSSPMAYGTPMAAAAPLAMPPTFHDNEKRFKAAMAYARRSPEFDAILEKKGVKTLLSASSEEEGERGRAEAVRAFEIHQARNEALAETGDGKAQERLASMKEAEMEVNA